jgi:hypothetical protein
MKKRSKFVAAVAAFAMVAGTSALAQTQPQNSDAAAHDHQHGSQTTQQPSGKSSKPVSGTKSNSKMMPDHGNMSDADHQKMMQQHMSDHQNMMQKHMDDHKGMSQQK